MTVAQFIAKLRVELKDFAKLQRDKFDGDATTTLFGLSTVPIKDATYVIKVSGVTKTETTDYTLDRDTGVLEFTSAPASGSDNIVVTYKSVKIRDEDYIEIIGDAIDYFKWKFWKMTTDEDTLTTVADQYEYDCSGITNILYVLNAWYKDSSSATVWQAIQSITNWKYYVEQVKLYIDPTIASNDLPIKLLYIRSLTKPTVVGDTLDIPTKWLLPYKYYIYARHYERLIPEKIHDVSAITTQPSFTPAQAIFNISQAFQQKADDISNKLAPKLPPMSIKQLHGGIAL